jgi:hypothetical protein
VNYEERRLDANLDLWRTGVRVLGSSSPPHRSRLPRGGARRLDGPILVRALADSVDLGILGALTRGHPGGGRLAADVQVEGTWDTPGSGQHRGEGREHDGARSRRAARCGGGGAVLRGDSLLLRDVQLTSEAALSAWRLDPAGGPLRPVLDLDFQANQFRAVDVRNFLTLTATGDPARGPVFGSG